jgi:type I restriction enzyme S subunit
MSELLGSLKETEIGPIPIDWEVVRLTEVAKVKYGKAKPKVEGTVPVVGSGGPYAWVDSPLVEFPTLVIGRKGTAGRVWLMEQPCWPSDTAFYLEWKQPIDVTFLFGYLTLNPLSGEHAKTTLPSLQRPDLESLLIPLPPLPEQRRIAHVLNTIQREIAAQDALIAAAREVKRSLMGRLFTYGPGAEPAPTKETEIGEIPEHWEVLPVGSLFEIQLGKMLSKAARQGISPRPYLRNANVQWDYIDLNDVSQMDFNTREREKFRLRRNDVLVCEGGEIGRTALWEEQIQECYYQKAIHRLRPKEPNILPRFFVYYMMLIFLVRQVPIVEGARSTIAHLPVEKLRLLPVALPSTDEQSEISRILDAAKRKIAAEEQRKAALQALFKSMLHQLMTGRLRV